MQITITTAGRAALINAENTGTAPVLLAEIGITPQAFTPDFGMTALPGELKRLTTFAGQAVADDTVHVTIRDDSQDAYTLRGFGLYLADGTLFALYGQSEPILEKSAQAMLLLATDILFAQINATSLTFGATNWINPPATTEVQGVVELATGTEASAGTDTLRAVTPAGVKAALDGRLGAGAPSSFVKGLLTAASAAVFRAALAIKSAALRDEGAGNGLDADKLDGQEGAFYQNAANVNTGTLPDARLSSNIVRTNDARLTDARSPTAHNHGDETITGVSWSKLSGVPLAFPPSAHGHVLGDITGSEQLATTEFVSSQIAAALPLALFVRKPNETQIANTGFNYVDDPHLILDVPQPGTYMLEWVLYCFNNADGVGIEALLSFTGTWSGEVFIRARNGVGVDVGPGHGPITANAAFSDARQSVGRPFINFEGPVIVSTPGQIGVRYRQVSSNAFATRIQGGSYIHLRKLP